MEQLALVMAALIVVSATGCRLIVADVAQRIAAEQKRKRTSLSEGIVAIAIDRLDSTSYRRLKAALAAGRSLGCDVLVTAPHGLELPRQWVTGTYHVNVISTPSAPSIINESLHFIALRPEGAPR